MRDLRALTATLTLVALAAFLAPAAFAAGDSGPVATPAAEPSPAATPALALTATPAAVTAGDPVRLVVRLGIPGATVQLSRTRAGETQPAAIGPLVTGAGGVVSYRVTPGLTTTYRVDYAGDGVLWLPASAEVVVTVRPRVAFSAPARVYRDRRAVLAVSVRPAHPGAAVSLQLLKDGVWADWRAVTLGDDSRGRASWRAGAVGTWPLRAVIAADAEHAAGRSGMRRVAVVKPNPYRVPIDAKSMIVVDISQYRLHFFSLGREVRSFPCVTGRPSLPTPIGHFKIYARGMWPGGPYGSRIMSYHPPCAIHGTNEPHLLQRFPRNFSHGCTRLSNADAIWLYDRAPLGTPVWNVP